MGRWLPLGNVGEVGTRFATYSGLLASLRTERSDATNGAPLDFWKRDEKGRLRPLRLLRKAWVLPVELSVVRGLRVISPTGRIISALCWFVIRDPGTGCSMPQLTKLPNVDSGFIKPRHGLNKNSLQAGVFFLAFITSRNLKSDRWHFSLTKCYRPYYRPFIYPLPTIQVPLSPTLGCRSSQLSESRSRHRALDLSRRVKAEEPNEGVHGRDVPECAIYIYIVLWGDVLLLYVYIYGTSFMYGISFIYSTSFMVGASPVYIVDVP